MIDPESIHQTLGRLIGWLETWRTPDGGYNGFVIHRTEKKRMRLIHDTAWTQAAIIRGFANLYRKSREPRWHRFLISAADLQASRFDPETGKYRFAGHEDDRFTSLVHCALANSALLSAFDLVDGERRAEYLRVVRRNIDDYWMSSLLVPSAGAFRFSEVDHYSPGEDRFVVNFNCMAAESLLALYEITGETGYRDTALATGDWLLERCESTRLFYSRQPVRREDAEIIPWGLPYQFGKSHPVPDNCVSLYAGLSLRGISALYNATRNSAFADIAKETIRFLLAMIDPETRLFHHTTRGDRVEPYPQFIAGTGMILTGIDEALEQLKGRSLPGDSVKTMVGETIEETIDSILQRAYANGSFPSFIGKGRSVRRKWKSDGTVWEDAAAGVNWNAQWFEYLTRLPVSPERIVIPPPSRKDAVFTLTDRFLYRDTPESVTLLSWWPAASIGCYHMKKKASETSLCLDPTDLTSRIRTSISNISNASPVQKCLKTIRGVLKT